MRHLVVTCWYITYPLGGSLFRNTIYGPNLVKKDALSCWTLDVAEAFRRYCEKMEGEMKNANQRPISLFEQTCELRLKERIRRGEDIPKPLSAFEQTCELRLKERRRRGEDIRKPLSAFEQTCEDRLKKQRQEAKKPVFQAEQADYFVCPNCLCELRNTYARQLQHAAKCRGKKQR